MRISLNTLGCKLNQAESDELKKELIKADFFIAPADSDEDIAIVRACAVTCGASQSVRATIRHLKKSCIYVITVGCLENKDMPEIDFVAKDNEDVLRHMVSFRPSVASGEIPLVHHIRDLSTLPTSSGSVEMTNEYKDEHSEGIVNRTRAFIKIQTGCNFNCAYCTIPHFRGQSQSIPAEKIIKKIKEAEQESYKEIILTGVNICQYNLEKINLSKLLEIILEKTNIFRIRLGSLDPRLISDELIKLYTILDTKNRLLPHWHLSLQSGSDEILKKMNRLYTAKHYLEIINKIRKNNPLFSFTTDIIVGFPGETTMDFEATCDLVKTAQFSKIHIFRFSPRPGTPARQMNQQISEKIKGERATTLKKISDIVAKKFAEQFIGKNVEVLFENKKSGVWSGYTPEYLQVKRHGQKNLQNKIISIKYQ